ncbi:MAG: ATP-dependent helicase [Oscillospiraceae bacterium]|nr:ATP-dependent helicase [Oscillospiraceae bacterium]
MFNFDRLNENQKKAVTQTEGPVLIIAGPGTGKTFTLVQRIAYLVSEKGVKPSEIMAVTFTEKAARELVTRISNEFASLEINANVNEMYIGTFHAVCLRLIKENTAFSGQKEKRILDAFEAAYLVCRHIESFRNCKGFRDYFPDSLGSWRQSLEICRYAGQMREELADIDNLINDNDEDVCLLAKITLAYRQLLEKNNALDFSGIQTEMYDMMQNDPVIAENIRNTIRYIMVDEYQDTNYIQEQLVFQWAGERSNICVVGDDDQGMYRFRGATIRNILEFPQKFPQGRCRQIYLDINYRSQPDIIRFYSRWMENPDGLNLFNWDKYRYPKNLKSGRSDSRDEKSVFRCGSYNRDIQKNEALDMVMKMYSSGYVSDLNQIAFLFRSVKGSEAKELADHFEENGIRVYSPRSEMFFERLEVRQVIGCLIMCFYSYMADLRANSFCHVISDKLREYYRSCIREAQMLAKGNEHLYAYIVKTSGSISTGEKSGDTLLDLFFKIISFMPFSAYLAADINSNISETRAARNLSEISRMISRFCFLHDMHEITDINRVILPEQFFNEYMRFLYIDGIGEYEDMSEYAPSGCISFMTIHQSKGLEFPVVVIGSLGARPMKKADPLMLTAEMRCFKRKPYEPLSEIKFFDFWRLYYTAFSRAQDLLVMSIGKNSKLFSDFTDGLPDIESFRYGGSCASKVKSVNFKRVYSYTSHISVYDGCPKQYLYYKEYGFAQHKMLHTSIGSLVHETLEDINRHTISGECVTEDQVKGFFEINCLGIREATGYELDSTQREIAYRHVSGYYNRRRNELRRAFRSEEEINLIMTDFILQGIIDLIEYDDENDTLVIIDYKTGRKPDHSRYPESVAHYRRQLEIYAYLVSQRFGKKVSSMKLYYTSAEDNEDPWITFDYNESDVQKAISEVSDTIRLIESRCFEKSVQNDYACQYCDMKYYCNKSGV